MIRDDNATRISKAANDLARRAGRLALERVRGAQASRKRDRTIVTDADLAVQKLIIDGIARQFPDHAVLAEEARSDDHRLPAPGQAEFCWVIDPIDGTRNFARGFPCFCTSLAVLRRGTPVIAAVYDPLLDRLYHGVTGHGACINDEPLQAKDDPMHPDSLVGVPSGHNKPMPDPVHRWLDRINLRNIGSTALHLAYVAAGFLDGAYAHECRVWDVAAGWLLVREAGATVTTPEGVRLFPVDPAAAARQQMPYLAAGPTLHAQLLASLADA